MGSSSPPRTSSCTYFTQLQFIYRTLINVNELLPALRETHVKMLRVVKRFTLIVGDDPSSPSDPILFDAP